MTTTAEIGPGIRLTAGAVWVLDIRRDRKMLAGGGLGKGKRGGSLVADSLVDLLRQTADFMDQEGITTLDALSNALDEVTGHNEALVY